MKEILDKAGRGLGVQSEQTDGTWINGPILQKGRKKRE